MSATIQAFIRAARGSLKVTVEMKEGPLAAAQQNRPS